MKNKRNKTRYWEESWRNPDWLHHYIFSSSYYSNPENPKFYKLKYLFVDTEYDRMSEMNKKFRQKLLEQSEGRKMD